VYEIIEKKSLAPEIVLLEIEAKEIAAKAEPGHFLIVRVDEYAERIPLTIADYNKLEGTITVIIQEVGFSSQQISNLKIGDQFLDVVGPLGQPISTDGYDRVVAVAGGLGAAPLYPKVKSLVEHDSEVLTVLGARNKDYLILEEGFAELSQELYLTTDDGSKGQEGFVTAPLEDILSNEDDIDLVIAIGPMIMMKSVAELTKEYNIDTIVSLNSLMIDGTGMCGGCRVTVDGETKFSCVDGPAFDGHQVDYNEQLRRQNLYQDYEAEAEEHSFWGDDCRVRQEES